MTEDGKSGNRWHFFHLWSDIFLIQSEKIAFTTNAHELFGFLIYLASVLFSFFYSYSIVSLLLTIH